MIGCVKNLDLSVERALNSAGYLFMAQILLIKGLEPCVPEFELTVPVHDHLQPPIRFAVHGLPVTPIGVRVLGHSFQFRIFVVPAHDQMPQSNS